MILGGLTSIVVRLGFQCDATVLALALQLGASTVTGLASPTSTVVCPHCGQSVPFPAATKDGDLSLAECDDCDIYFDVPTTERRKRREPAK